MFRNRLVILLTGLILWVAVLGWLGRHFDYIDLWGMMLAGAGLITFFGVLALPESTSGDGDVSESRLRLAICATVLVVYLVYFGSAVYLTPGTSEGKEVDTFAKVLFPTLTNLLSITIAFYFASSAAVNIARKRDNN